MWDVKCRITGHRTALIVTSTKQLTERGRRDKTWNSELTTKLNWQNLTATINRAALGDRSK